uniref:Uncharacterized protein n=1 Tax=Ascaris lumbricoides TaxID=6252 RepID=A0A0M3HM37_ASCLU
MHIAAIRCITRELLVGQILLGGQINKSPLQIPDFRILVYNGDLDTVCDFLGDAWHISALAKQLRMQVNYCCNVCHTSQIEFSKEQFFFYSFRVAICTAFEMLHLAS